jgi:hypothetical protein
MGQGNFFLGTQRRYLYHCIRKSRRNTSHVEIPKRQSKIEELRRNKEEKTKKLTYNQQRGWKCNFKGLLIGEYAN